ncbi:hypothetical protein AB6G96_07750 [Staphylococcus haemolyticus]|uniref:Uncharacterized protein n=1 Tax=Staphylococcus haemolyticus TaxID=1283 RepID=A0ABU3IEG0_STAHA|nr:hypothetical protein [Staphylococcus haemolyticus]AKC76365.1 hypothetical protein ShL2_01505 [Staphylococcus haemolyticus]MBE7361678.1 hypothetical protein [Staphylococcus haemolyticus]MBE7377449.1 hypothetical protein [Staphylococcus haemolyticus]MBF2285957.1 hypothetical protein [Staphylococcus haemolyticus]MBF2299818.1 hypothetical protein [Staphylococcus haemolyticus]
MDNDKEIRYQKLKSRFFYISIILGLIIISLVTLFFYRDDNAWLFLSFAGTAISIVLSVIAILITLIDVAGQRQQIADISESAKTLSRSTETLKKSIEDYQNDKNEIKQIINTAFNESIGNKLDEQTNEFIGLLERLKSESNGSEELEKNINEIKDLVIKSNKKEKLDLNNRKYTGHVRRGSPVVKIETDNDNPLNYGNIRIDYDSPLDSSNIKLRDE